MPFATFGQFSGQRRPGGYSGAASGLGDTPVGRPRSPFGSFTGLPNFGGYGGGDMDPGYFATPKIQPSIFGGMPGAGDMDPGFTPKIPPAMQDEMRRRGIYNNWKNSKNNGFNGTQTLVNYMPPPAGSPEMLQAEQWHGQQQGQQQSRSPFEAYKYAAPSLQPTGLGGVPIGHGMTIPAEFLAGASMGAVSQPQRPPQPVGAHEMLDPMGGGQSALDMINVGMNGVGQYSPPQTGKAVLPTPPPPPRGSYGAMGIAAPNAGDVAAGRQTPGFYRSIGGENPSGTNMANGGYYTPDITSQIPRREFTPEQAMDQNAQHNNLDSRWAMQYPQGQLQPRGPQTQEPQVASMQEGRFKVGDRFGNSTIQEVNGRKVLVGDGHSASEVPLDRPRVSLNTGGQSYAQATPEEMNRRRLEHIKGQDQRRDMLGAGRNIMAHQRTGAPLRPDLFPKAESAYAPRGQQSGIADIISQNTSAAGEDGTPGKTNYGTVLNTMWGNPKFQSDPKAAAKELVAAGVPPQEIEAAIADMQPGPWGADVNPQFRKWSTDVRDALVPQPGTPGGPIGAPAQPGYAGYNPLDPVNSLLGTIPSFGFSPLNPMNPFPVVGGRESAPPLPRKSKVTGRKGEVPANPLPPPTVGMRPGSYRPQF